MARVHEMALLFLLLMQRRRRRRIAAYRQTWAKNGILRRPRHGVYANLLRELNAEDPETFRQYHRLDTEGFNKILSMVGPVIQKKDTVMRTSISPGERLAITVRFLATGK